MPTRSLCKNLLAYACCTLPSRGGVLPFLGRRTVFSPTLRIWAAASGVCSQQRYQAAVLLVGQDSSGRGRHDFARVAGCLATTVFGSSPEAIGPRSHGELRCFTSHVPDKYGTLSQVAKLYGRAPRSVPLKLPSQSRRPLRNERDTYHVLSTELIRRIAIAIRARCATTRK